MAGKMGENSTITPPAEALTVLCTCPNAGEANRIARALVEEALAACVNIVPGVRSIFYWQGTVEEADEQLLIIKAPAGKFAGLEARIRALHSYAVPEVLALPVAAGSGAYLDWLSRCGR
jgi:periplasmic divalent cation tolerance protein